MMNMNIRRILSQTALITGTLLFSAGIQTFAAFTQPTTSPPNSDAYAPISTGPTAQSKSGGLLLNTGGAANGLIVQAGNVGIGTTVPAEKLEVSGNIKLSGTSPTYKIANLLAPTNSSDAATKGYVDAAINGSGYLFHYIDPPFSGTVLNYSGSGVFYGLFGSWGGYEGRLSVTITIDGVSFNINNATYVTAFCRAGSAPLISDSCGNDSYYPPIYFKNSLVITASCTGGCTSPWGRIYYGTSN